MVEIEIISQEKQPLLSRSLITAKVTFEGATPSRGDIKNSLVSKIKSAPEFTVIKKISTNFGTSSAKVDAFVFENEKVMKFFSKKVKADKNKAAPKGD